MKSTGTLFENDFEVIPFTACQIGCGAVMQKGCFRLAAASAGKSSKKVATIMDPATPVGGQTKVVPLATGVVTRSAPLISG